MEIICPLYVPEGLKSSLRKYEYIFLLIKNVIITKSLTMLKNRTKLLKNIT